IAFPNGEQIKLWDKTINNELDKIVSVTNVGTEDAYVRTILAFETNTVYKEGTSDLYGTGDAHWEYINVNGDFEYLKDGEEFVTIEIDDVKYVLAVKVYDDAISTDERTAPSLKQVFMAPTANNEVMSLFGSEYTILALSQAVQAQGFEADAEKGLTAAEVALNAGFGEVTAENAVKWFTEAK
ncbi:MAG: hypothetical protein J6B76_05685, partial [Peptococcaceae bacterium]|nr:hypothetical protein [Peptococcaceae bacterium]